MLNARGLTTHCVMIAGLAWMAVPAFAASSALPTQVKDAWIRWLPAGLPAGGYVVLRNIGDKPVVLTGAESPDYGSTMLHETSN